MAHCSDVEKLQRYDTALESLPPPFSGKFTSTFAYQTIKDRLPAILVRIIDTLCRNKDSLKKEFGEKSAEDIKQITGALSQMRSELMTDKPLQPLDHRGDSAVLWNGILNRLTKTHHSSSWFGLPWLYIECYLYRRVHEIFLNSKCLSTYDVYKENKCDAFTSSLPGITTLVEHLDNLLSHLSASDHDQLRKNCLDLVHVDLWGNKCDLSISAGNQNSQLHSPLDQMKLLQSHVLVDQAEKIYECLTAARCVKLHVSLHVVLDNAGFELFTDFCLLEFLTSSRLVDSVHLHGKTIPWFISDVTEADLVWTLDQLEVSNNNLLLRYGKRWKKYLKEKVWIYTEHPFWCYPLDYAAMTSYTPDLYQYLSEADLILFKGDLNYRKLTGDLMWDNTAIFADTLRGFRPAPLCVLRTIKADVVVGLSPGQGHNTSLLDPEWKTNGNWALIQFADDQ